MKSSIIKLNKYLKKAPSIDKHSTKEAINGKIFIDPKVDIGKELILVDNKKQPLTNRKSDVEAANADWQRMFSHSDKSSTSPMGDYISAGISSTHFSDTPSTSLVEYSMPEKNFIQGNDGIRILNLMYGFCHFVFLYRHFLRTNVRLPK